MSQLSDQSAAWIPSARTQLSAFDAPPRTPSAVRDSGSFRDPSGFIFVDSKVLFRQVNRSYQVHYDQLMGSGLAAALMKHGLLIHHEEVPVTVGRGTEAYKILKPLKVPFISYPYEWSFSQLRDAALVTLRAQRYAIKYGMSLKDASAYNVQFIGSQPVLIDTLSFEKYEDGSPWVAYRQFCQHFFAPLALMATTDVRLNQLFRVFIDGVPLDLASSLLPWRTRLRPSTAVHVHLHARLQKKHGNDQGAAARKSRRLSKTALSNLVEGMERSIRALTWAPVGTEWADYYSQTNYTEPALADKAQFVQECLERSKPQTVWDLGANTGRFSRLASAQGITTMAFDVDAAAVEKNYREASASADRYLLPLVLDLSNPSGGIGWSGEERLSIQARGPADTVIALALIHHLAIGNNVPLWKIADLFSAIVARDLIVEFVPKQDSQVERLLASRADVFPDYDVAAFSAAFSRHFDIVTVHQVRDTKRTLFHMRRH